MKNWKTTLVGVLTIVGAVAYAVVAFLNTGSLDGETVKAVIAAVMGSGFIAASDAQK